MRESFASISIDLDSLDCYHDIHGLTCDVQGDPIHQVALSRFFELFDELGINATLFVITRCLKSDTVTDALVGGMSAGHELASHTHNHPYDFRSLSASRIEQEITQSVVELETRVGRRPIGFRAPGYNVSSTILDCLEKQGFLYDSSIFPCPPYYLAKTVIMGTMRLFGRRSRSSMTDPRGLLAPTQPYRPHQKKFYRASSTHHRSLWEIPIGVLPWSRFPIIGTSLALIGSKGFSAVYPMLRHSQRYLSLEFHGIDLLDRSDKGVSPELVERQPDLRRPVADKVRIFRDVFRRIQNDYQIGTLAQMVEKLDHD